MKKLAIVLALVMALSCLGIAAFAEGTATINITVQYHYNDRYNADNGLSDQIDQAVKDLNQQGKPDDLDEPYSNAPDKASFNEASQIQFIGKEGTVVKAADIIAAVKDDYRYKEAVKANVVTIDDVVTMTAPESIYNFKNVELKADETYNFTVTVTVDSIGNLAETIGSSVGKINWGSIADANISVLNSIIGAVKGATASLAKADWPDTKAAKADAKDAAPAADTNANVTETPNTGVGAVAGAAVIVLALSATTAVVLHKKED